MEEKEEEIFGELPEEEAEILSIEDGPDTVRYEDAEKENYEHINK